MSVSQANGGALSTSRRRRRGGRGGGNSRGDARSTLWEEGNARVETRTASTNRGDGDSGNVAKQQSAGASPSNLSAKAGKGKVYPAAVRSGGGGGGSGSGGRQAKEARPLQAETPGVHPAMLESEFLASTGQADVDASGVASLSLEEVPYDRDLRWCNTSSTFRPRPTMDTSSGVFGRVGSAITQDTGEYERLDRHYQELWKDREENGPPPTRGRGNRASRGGRTRGRGSNASGRNGGGPRSSMMNGQGREDAARHGTPSRRDKGSNGVGRTGVRGGKGSSRNPAEKGAESNNVARAGGQRPVAAAPHSNGGGKGAALVAGAAAQRRSQRVAAGGTVGRGGSGGGGGAKEGALTSRSVQPVLATAYRFQAAAAAATAAATTSPTTPIAAVPSWQGMVGGGSPAGTRINGHPEWEGQERQAPSHHHNLTPRFGPWVMEPGRSLSPVGPTRFSPGPNGATAIIRTPPLVPAMSSLFGGPLPESPEYLGDLANVLSVAPSEPAVGLTRPLTVGQQSLALSPPLGPALLAGSAVRDRNGFGGGEGGSGGGGGEGVTAAHNGGAALSPYLSSPRAKTFADIRALADPSLEVDIQDICADPDLNANAPAFVPGRYIST